MTDTRGQPRGVDGASPGAASSSRAAERVSWAIIGLCIVAGRLVAAFGIEAVKVARRPGDTQQASGADQDNEPLPEGATS